MTTKLITLSPSVRKLAARVASERYRAKVWAEGAALRAAALERLRKGDSPEAVQEFLEQELRAALAGQAG